MLSVIRQPLRRTGMRLVRKKEITETRTPTEASGGFSRQRLA